MKKIILTFLLLNCVILADTPFKHEFRFGYDLSGSTKADDESFSHKNNFELVYEFYDEVYYNLDFGFGIIARRESEAKKLTILNADSEEESLANFTPLYATIKYRFPLKKFSPFVKLNLGYSFNHSSDFLEENNYSAKDSLYYSAGTGIEVNNYIFDISYQVINYKIESSSDSISLENSRTTFSFGYQFE